MSPERSLPIFKLACATFSLHCSIIVAMTLHFLPRPAQRRDYSPRRSRTAVRALLPLAILATGATNAANWKIVDLEINDCGALGKRIAVDLNSIDAQGGLRHLRLRTDYPQTQTEDNRFRYRSSIDLVQFDCIQNSIKIIERTYYSQSNAGGFVVRNEVPRVQPRDVLRQVQTIMATGASDAAKGSICSSPGAGKQ
ncbi:surface-adhesin E family protein [Variovorax saccharolyticus]|uniref:surface-adhesin E family protein n=1 Tax=Variovorax saccharolyticus TaxID=3053516 RepID=UPI002578B655|nr:surface-adhesin E family protein [Variovorax sp. J31P216]MDM0028378.1 hypothetical protein [Variovorax sp. J31P216]